MFSAIPPYTLNFLAFSLIILCLLAGHSPKFLPGFALVTIEATDWKEYVINNYTQYNFTQLEDVYKVYIKTHCDGYKNWDDDGQEKLLNLTCSNARFLPDHVIGRRFEDIILANKTMTIDPRSRWILSDNDDGDNGEDETTNIPPTKGDGDGEGDETTDISPNKGDDGGEGDTTAYDPPQIATGLHILFPDYVQLNFVASYNKKFRIAFVFYIIGLVWSGLALAVGISAFFKGTRGFGISLLTFPAGICWLVSSTIVTQTRDEILKEINLRHKGGPLDAKSGKGLIAFTWTAFAFVCVSAAVWPFAASASWDYRKNRGQFFVSAVMPWLMKLYISKGQKGKKQKSAVRSAPE